MLLECTDEGLALLCRALRAYAATNATEQEPTQKLLDYLQAQSSEQVRTERVLSYLRTQSPTKDTL